MKSTISNIFNTIWEAKFRFFITFFVVSLLTYSALYYTDIIPEPVPSAETEVTAPIEEAPRAQQTITDKTPTYLIIDSLKKKVAINNPASTDVADLDAALLTGTARYPGTANMQDNSTMFLFGHSSHLAYVKNKNYQAFNDIEKLVWGDTIRIQSSSHENVYRVDRVYQQKASVASVDLVRDAQTLTLVTCNTFGAKDDRYVVEATLIASHAI